MFIDMLRVVIWLCLLHLFDGTIDFKNIFFNLRHIFLAVEIYFRDKFLDFIILWSQ